VGNLLLAEVLVQAGLGRWYLRAFGPLLTPVAPPRLAVAESIG
jgi:hypothetical protein